MPRGDEDAQDADAIGPEAGARDVPPDTFAPCCPHCGRPMPLSDEGVVAWT